MSVFKAFAVIECGSMVIRLKGEDGNDYELTMDIAPMRVQETPLTPDLARVTNGMPHFNVDCVQRMNVRRLIERPQDPESDNVVPLKTELN